MGVSKQNRWRQNKLFSYVDNDGKSCICCMCLGPRGNGKTFQMKETFIRNYIKTGAHACYVMRHKEDIERATQKGNFFKDSNLQALFPDYEFTSDPSFGYIRKVTEYNEDEDIEKPKWEPFIMFQYMSSNSLKAITDLSVNIIVYDEFIPLPGGRYLKNEVERFLEFYITISRDRDIRMVFLANVVTTASPYFSFFGVKLPKPGEFYVNKLKGVVVENSRSEAFVEEMKATKTAKLIEGSAYFNYAIDGKSLQDLSTFVSPRPDDAYCKRVLKSNAVTLFLWSSRGGIWLSLKGDKNCPIWAIDEKSHDNTSELINANTIIRNFIKRYHVKGLLNFDSEQAKAEFFANFTVILT